MSGWDITLSVAALPVFLTSGYLALLAALARRPRQATYGEPRCKFDVIIPAHDEELGIARTVESLLAVDYPQALRRVLVVADNCQDETASRAVAAGATVLERTHAELRGKGYALDFAFAKSRADGFADAVVVVDADSSVSANLLRAFDAQLQTGAQALQANYGVRNPLASWRTRLMTLALALFNDLRSLGRERMGLSTGLRGNGMCFTHALLASVPHHAYSVVEDLEYGIRIGRAGFRVEYAPNAEVKGDMVASEHASRSQRERWESGRWTMAQQHATGLLADGVSQRSAVLVDLGLDLLVAPLSYVVLAAFLLSACAVGLAVAEGTLRLLPVFLLAATDAALLAYVLRGWALSGVGARGLLDLLWAPVFIAWKVMLLLSGKGRSKKEWVRTTREGETKRHGTGT